ncbi:unannotated protein [freshwater metagenome]|uniref:Unannotated protein n=1 Tax=freshwater metagenome TaxID=449393 RepID=A0A6J7Y229_9ZZZZ|nr:hypothetical protein [Actinomycetota bacterium]
MFDTGKNYRVMQRELSRVLIAENGFHPANGKVVANGIENHSDGKVNTLIGDFTKTTELLNSFMPDLLLLDLDSLRKIDALNTALEARNHDDQVTVVFMTEQPSIAFVREGMISPLWHRAYWLEKPTRNPESIVEELHDAHNGTEQVSSEFLSACIDETYYMGILSPQQHRVMRLMAKGASNLEIANACKITEKAVERTISTASKLLNVEPASRQTNHRVNAANKYMRALFYTDSISL